MKRIFQLLLIFSLFIIITACTSATATPTQTPESTSEETPMNGDVFEINQKLGRGVNLGNALEAPAEGEWGVTLEEAYFQLIADQGFDAVRIPIRWSAHAADEAPYTIDPEFFARIDWAVENSLSRGLAVVINFHHYEEIFLDPEGHEERFLALWEQVAEHYQDSPPELVFEILNEPHDQLSPSRWNELLVKALAVIRATNPTRAVIIGPGEWNNVYALESLQLPETDRYLIVTVHYYLPFEFTHQGAEWAEGSDAWLGTSWEGTSDEKDALATELKLAADWAEAHDRPMYLGEFGAYYKADLLSRMRWTDFVARTAEGYGFSWAYWEFCAGFGVYDPAAQIWNKPLVEALLPPE